MELKVLPVSLTSWVSAEELRRLQEKWCSEEEMIGIGQKIGNPEIEILRNVMMRAVLVHERVAAHYR